MDKRAITGGIIACGIFLGLAVPVRAQIASTLDEKGGLVFVNAEPAKTRRVATQALQPGRPVGSNWLKSSETAEPAVPPERLERIVQDAAARQHLDPALVKAVIGVESGWNPAALSNKGAQGLMQLIPTTAGELGVGNAFDPEQNVNGGAAYLRTLLDRFHGDLEKSLAAYNAGPGVVERVGGVPNIPETRSYVRKVTDSYFRPGSGRDPALFESRHAPVRREVDENGRVVFTNE
jgi:soluble lytic murein transglycosylase-like protein